MMVSGTWLFGHINVVASARMHKSFELKAVVPQGFRGTRADHFARGAPFNLTDAAFSGLLPWGIGFGHSRVAISLSEFSSEVTQGLLFRAIKNHGWENSIMMEQEGQGLTSVNPIFDLAKFI